MAHPAFWLATWFGSGLLRPAPGTWGSLAALPPAWLLVHLGGVPLLAAGIVAVSLAGWWAAERYTGGGKSDPGEVVIDEVAGQWVVLLAAPLDLGYYAAGFVLFRALDITKPWPASWADRKLPGGLGIMLDDILAAGYGLAALLVFRYLW